MMYGPFNPSINNSKDWTDPDDLFFQPMPERRVRVNPEVRAAVDALILAHSRRYWAALVKTERGLEGAERDAVVGARRHARHALTTLDTLRRALLETIDGDGLLACCEALDAIGHAPTLVQLASLAGGDTLTVEG